MFSPSIHNFHSIHHHNTTTQQQHFTILERACSSIKLHFIHCTNRLLIQQRRMLSQDLYELISSASCIRIVPDNAKSPSSSYTEAARIIQTRQEKSRVKKSNHHTIKSLTSNRWESMSTRSTKVQCDQAPVLKLRNNDCYSLAEAMRKPLHFKPSLDLNYLTTSNDNASSGKSTATMISELLTELEINESELLEY
jgi:hypothetical protein